VTVEVRAEPMLGIPLTLRLEVGTDARLELEAAEGVVEGVLERTRDARDVFFCSVGGWLGRYRVGMEGFLRNCSVDWGGRS
jgi:hypothetical protein